MQGSLAAGRWIGDGSLSAPMDPTLIDDVFSHGDIMAQISAGTSASNDPDKGRIGTIGSIGNAGGVYSASHINRIRTAGTVTASFLTSTAAYDGTNSGTSSTGGTQVLQNQTTLLSNVPKPVLDPSVRDQVLTDASAAKSEADADRLDVIVKIDGLKEALKDFRKSVLDEVSALRDQILGRVNTIQLAADVAVVVAQGVAQGVVHVVRFATDAELKQAAAEFQTEMQKYVSFRDTSYQQMFDARQDAWAGRIETQKLLNAADDDVAKKQQAIRDQFAAKRADRQFYWEARIWKLAQEMAGSMDAARDLLYDPDYQTDWTPFLDSIETALDVAGMLPVVGIVPDLINVAFTASRGKWGTAGFNLVAAIPGIGDAAKGAKMLAVAGTTVGTGVVVMVIKKNGDEALEKALKLGDDAVQQADEAAGLVGGVSRFVAGHVDEFIDGTVDAWVAAGKSKTFVIGEGQLLIGKHIREQLGGDALEFRKIWPDNMRFKLGDNGLLSAADEATLIEFNKHLIRRLHEKGFKFIDTGRDGRLVPSKFYEAELQVLRELGEID